MSVDGLYSLPQNTPLPVAVRPTIRPSGDVRMNPQQQPRLVEVRQQVLKKNDVTARALRRRFADAGVFVVSLVSSPGAGKTAFLERTLSLLRDGPPPAPPPYPVAAPVGALGPGDHARRPAP